ncbi:FAD binding domain-containing protein [Ancylobacter sonchi]|uniref:FAD binding domain-containing protein n=1 Tax=Ancylobacter sonchi TaxID=1937790 RepID=UPI001BD4EAC6|nr:FAD binding domain-containing protein [Ancylobacter sonchi]MBS7533427.1 FAD binding domain-containing protein [Ancylobacter sonchi]
MGLSYRRFEKVSAATSFLTEEAGACVVGGGTLLVRRVNEGDAAVTTYVRVCDPEMKRIDEADGRIRLGALVTMAQLLGHPGLQWLAPAARIVGGPAIRSAATVGGNLFAASPYGDFGVALLALGAVVTVHGAVGVEEWPLAEFFARRDSLPAGLIVTSVAFTRPEAGTFRFVKASRVKPKGAAIVSIAAVIARDAGRVGAARIAFGAMAGTPIRASSFERALIGEQLITATLDRLEPHVTEGTTPPSDAIASAWYRQAVLPVHLRRLLLPEIDG